MKDRKGSAEPYIENRIKLIAYCHDCRYATVDKYPRNGKVGATCIKNKHLGTADPARIEDYGRAIACHNGKPRE